MGRLAISTVAALPGSQCAYAKEGEPAAQFRAPRVLRRAPARLCARNGNGAEPDARLALGDGGRGPLQVALVVLLPLQPELGRAADRPGQRGRRDLVDCKRPSDIAP